MAWTDNRLSGSVYALVKNVANDTAPAVLAKNQSGPLGVAVDGQTSFVYFTTYGDGKLMRARKSGLGSPEVVLTGLDHPAFMASDANFLYFTTFGSGPSDGTLLRVTKPLN